MKTNLIEEIRKQDNGSVLSFMQSLHEKGIYTEHVTNLTPMLEGKDTYILGTDEQIVAILIDTERPWDSDSLADEEMFNDEPPLWFEADCHRVSPVYRLMQFTHALRQLCRLLGKMQPTIHTVLITQTYVINFDDIKPVHEFLGATLFHHLSNLNNFAFTTGSGKDTPAAKLMANYWKYSHLLSWEPDKNFDRMADEYVREIEPSVRNDNDGKKEEQTRSEANAETESDFFLFEDELDFLEPSIDLPEMGALRAELIAPIPRSKARKQLERLVGCQQLKKFVSDMCSFAEYNRRLTFADNSASPVPLCLNSIFMGNPGTAKSTVARMMGSLLRGKVLSKGHVIMASRSTFVGQNWGMEEERVDRLLEMSKGGVLVIDEAYMLMGTGHKDDPAKLVLPLMLSKLADERENDRMVILCGYTKPMKQLIDTNPGLTSRFPSANRFEFQDLNVDGLTEVFYRRLQDLGNYRLTRCAREQVKSIITHAYQDRDKTTFGNGRYVVNLLNSIIREHSRRIVASNIRERDKLLLLTAADVKPLEVPEKGISVGFHLS